MSAKPPRRTRERILERSLRLFNELGEPNVTASAIADDLRISPGDLHCPFANKEAIVNARRFSGPVFQAESVERGTEQVIALLRPWLTPASGQRLALA